MSPENTHKLMGFYMEGLILGVNTMYMFFCFFKLFLIGCIGLRRQRDFSLKWSYLDLAKISSYITTCITKPPLTYLAYGRPSDDSIWLSMVVNPLPTIDAYMRHGYTNTSVNTLYTVFCFFRPLLQTAMVGKGLTWTAMVGKGLT